MIDLVRQVATGYKVAIPIKTPVQNNSVRERLSPQSEQKLVSFPAAPRPLWRAAWCVYFFYKLSHTCVPVYYISSSIHVCQLCIILHMKHGHFN